MGGRSGGYFRQRPEHWVLEGIRRLHQCLPLPNQWIEGHFRKLGIGEDSGHRFLIELQAAQSIEISLRLSFHIVDCLGAQTRGEISDSLQGLGLFRLVVGKNFGIHLGGSERDFGQFLRNLRAAEDAVQRIEIRRRNGVVFVIVTAGANHRQPHQATGHHVDPVIDLLLGAPQKAWPHREKTQRCQRRIVSLQAQQIRCDLFADKLTVGLVVIEGTDDIVAVCPGERVAEIHRGEEILRVRIARDVQPVAPPALAEMRRGEQFIDLGRDGRIGIAGKSRDKGFHLCITWRQSGEIEMQPLQKRGSLCTRRGGQALFPAPRIDQRINRRRPLLQRFRRCFHHGLKRPMRDRLLEKQRLIAEDFLIGIQPFPGPHSALIDPGAQDRNRRVRQGILLRRHLHLRLEVRDEKDQRTLRALPGNNRRSITTAAHQRHLTGVEPQPTLLLLGSVARHTMLREHRMNVAKVFHRPLHRLRQIQSIATCPLRRRYCGQRGEEKAEMGEVEKAASGHHVFVFGLFVFVTHLGLHLLFSAAFLRAACLALMKSRTLSLLTRL